MKTAQVIKTLKRFGLSYNQTMSLLRRLKTTKKLNYESILKEYKFNIDSSIEWFNATTDSLEYYIFISNKNGFLTYNVNTKEFIL